MRLAFLLCLLPGLLLGACTKTNALYCCDDGNCGDGPARTCDDPRFPTCDNTTHTCVGAPVTVCDEPADCETPMEPVCSVDGVCERCELETDCTRFNLMPHCDTSDGACVGCRVDMAALDCATAAKPVCDETTRSCRGCRVGSECDSGLCLVDDGQTEGLCAASAEVAYVAMTGAGAACTEEAPCREIQDAIALRRGGEPVPYVLVGAGMYGTPLTVADRSVHIVAPERATVLPSTNGANGLTITGSDSGASYTVRVEGVVFQEASRVSGQRGYGVSCNSLGATMQVILRDVIVADNDATGVLMVSDACSLDLARAEIHGNAQGGVDLGTGTFRIVNTTFAANQGSSWSAIHVRAQVAAGSLIAFCSFSQNLNTDTVNGAAVLCDQPGTAVHSIVSWGNAAKDVRGQCTPEYSNLADTPAAGSNLSVDPLFTDAPTDLKLLEGSPVRGQGKPQSGIVDDFERQLRPATAPDMGADQFGSP